MIVCAAQKLELQSQTISQRLHPEEYMHATYRIIERTKALISSITVLDTTRLFRAHTGARTVTLVATGNDHALFGTFIRSHSLAVRIIAIDDTVRAHILGWGAIPDESIEETLINIIGIDVHRCFIIVTMNAWRGR